MLGGEAADDAGEDEVGLLVHGSEDADPQAPLELLQDWDTCVASLGKSTMQPARVVATTSDLPDWRAIRPVTSSASAMISDSMMR